MSSDSLDSVIYIRYTYDSIAAYLYNLEFTMGHECNFASVLLSNYLKKYVSAWFANYFLFRVFSANLAFKNYNDLFPETNILLVGFEIESTTSNFLAREIARSVLRNGLFQSYLAFGGPS